MQSNTKRTNPEDYEGIKEVADAIVALLKTKGEDYGVSWRSSGGLIAFANLIRKFDRLNVQAGRTGGDIFQAFAEKPVELMETLEDIAGYCLLHIQTLREIAKENDKPLTIRNIIKD